jgi:hypothetical protein
MFSSVENYRLLEELFDLKFRVEGSIFRLQGTGD